MRPSTIQAWARGVQTALAPNYARTVFAHLSMVLTAAVDDGLITRNPCRAGSVTRPKREAKQVNPWTLERAAAVAAHITPSYEVLVVLAASVGMRQGEAFALSVDDFDFLRGIVHIRRQGKLLRGRTLIFAPPKGAKVRDVPLPESLALTTPASRSAPTRA